MKRLPFNQDDSNQEEADVKEVRFIGGSHDDLRSMPDEVRRDYGFQLWLLQNRITPSNATPFEGSRANEVMKLTERHDTDTYRCIYAAKFEGVVYVLHVFQKKSRSGIATPQSDIDLVYRRLAQAKAEYEEDLSKRQNTEKQ